MVVVDLVKGLETWNINQQSDSPLFTKLPPELRLTIFTLALAQDWKELGNGLLATCRRAFAEGHKLIYEAERWHKGYYVLPPNLPRRLDPSWSGYDSSTENGYGFYHTYPTGYWSRQRADWEHPFKRIRMAHGLHEYYKFLRRTSYPQYWDMRGFNTKYFQFSRMEHLRISPDDRQAWDGRDIGRQGEFYGKTWCPLLKRTHLDFIDSSPLRNIIAMGKKLLESKEQQNQQQQADHQEQAKSAPSRPEWITPPPEGLPCSYPVGSWAREFVNMPHIRTLTMDFHCDQTQRIPYEAWIEEVVIKTWRFPLNPKHHQGYHYLSAEGNPVRKLSWRGAEGHVENICTECGADRVLCHNDADWCQSYKLVEERALIGRGLRMYTWTVTWTRRKYEGPEVYPYNGCVEVDDDDYQDEWDSDMDSEDEAKWEFYTDWSGNEWRPPA
uniref:F-box domain-containing protein n=1 Tax=Pyricularia oryzae (strain P131) TaxID=1143193 RepID=L7IUV7_PYRO1